MKELWTEQETPEVRNTYQYGLDLKNRLEETCELARKSLYEAQGVYKHHYDKKARDRRFQVGDKVLVLLPTDHNKLLLQWKGPHEVVEVVNQVDYKVKVKGKPKLYNVNLLKKYLERDDGDDVEAAAMAVIEPEIEHGAVDDEGLLELGAGQSKETVDDVSVCETLSREQKDEVHALLSEFQDICTEQPGATNLVEHVIETTTTDPIRVKPYPIPYALRQVVEDEVKKMLEAGIIERSNSPYNSPIVLVKKKDGSYRFCIDFRRLNMVTKFDSEPMPNPDDILAKLAKDKFFTKLDLSKGYWQIPVAPECRHMTAFTTPQGCFQFRKMPFGLVNSAATFNRMMRKVLEGVEHADSFVDDVLDHTETWSTHMSVLRKIFERIREAGLTIRPSKTMIGYTNLGFIGHNVGSGQVAMEADKLTKIEEAPRPKTKQQVRSFLGLAGYYRKFIPNFSTIAVPLTDLTKKGQPNIVRWGEAQEKSFQTLKHMLTQAPILRLPDFTRPFIVQADASETGVGAVLLQEYEDGRFPVAYVSKKLKSSERNYSVIERECLALVFAIKKFYKYLYGKEFVLQTDHEPLAHIQKMKAANGRLMKYALFLQFFRYRVEAIKGSENVGADYMSRLE